MPVAQPSLFSKDQIFRPQNYGSIDPTGSADSSTAIQAAINARNATNYGGTIELPPGRFKISTALTDTAPAYDANHGWGYQYGRVFQGAGDGATTLVAGSGLAAPILTVTGDSSALLPTTTIRDIGFNANAQTSASCLKLTEVSNYHLSRLLIMGATGGSTLAAKGLWINGSLVGAVDHVQVYNCVNGIYVDSTTIGAFQTEFRALKVGGCTGWGINVASGSNLTFTGVDLEGNGTASDATTGCIFIQPSASGSFFKIAGPAWWEANATGSTMIKNASPMLVFEGPTYHEGKAIINSGTMICRDIGSTGSTSTITNSGTVRLENCPSLTVSGGTSSTWH